MRNYVLVLFSLVTITVKSQDVADDRYTIFNNLLNYTPKNFSIDEVSKPKGDFLGFKMNSISQLKMVYKFQRELNLGKEEIKWLDLQIDQMALAFYLEGNPILIKATGGYDGCGGEKVSKELINNVDVTVLNFCFTCSGAGKLENFISIFNNRTKKLLK